MQGMLYGCILIEIDYLNAAILVTGVEGAVSGINCQRLSYRRQKECPQCLSSLVIPYYGSIILGSRDGNTSSTAAVTNCERGDGGAVVQKGSERTIGRLFASACGRRFRKGEKPRYGPDMDIGVWGTRQDKVGRCIYN